jgi:hypothetical protein
MKKTSGAKNSVLMNKSRLQYASGFGRKKQDGIKNMLNLGKVYLSWKRICSKLIVSGGK